MFSKFIKKKQAPAEAKPELPLEITAEAAWESRLEAAAGNDSELLALAIDAPSIDQKLACVKALTSEEGLRAIEREFRKRDRRVHSLAKQRHEILVKQRETRTRAAELIQTAAALVDAATIPANRLAELNQAWKRLDQTLIEDEDMTVFARLQADLAELLRERGERKRAVSRWSSAANQTLAELSSACAGATATGMRELDAMLSTAKEKARSTLAAMPAITPASVPGEGEIAALGAAIQAALQDLEQIEARLAILCELQACRAQQHEPLNDQVFGNSVKAAIERWQGLPSIANQRIKNALDVRFDECVQEMARNKQQGSVIAGNKDKAVLHAHIQELMISADAAEAALASGHLDEAGKHLAILQAASDKDGVSAELQFRIGALQSEFSRLRGWQNWGGGRAREELVLEALALASSTLVPEGSRPVKLPIRQIEKHIEQLRMRWKELDRLGGATSKTIWQSFDEALKTAYLPVAAHLARLNEARQENLAARMNLLNAMDALTVDEQNAPDWKEIKKALDHFKIEWRKLGPVEHTTPHKAQQALLDRMKDSVARLEQPLKEAQADARSEREQLIARAMELGSDVHGRDVLAKVRELQSQWQSHARSHPLPRKTENMLWAEFRAATDALMRQREAAFSAREAEFKANQAMREAVIVRLEEIHKDTPPADIRQILDSVDAEWQKAGDAPRNQAARLESRYRAAREQAYEHIAGSARRSWQLACDALLARLALCEELESAASSRRSATEIEAGSKTLPALPHCWERALQARCNSARENSLSGKSGGADCGERLDRLLLQLESALDIPSPADFQHQRRALRLQAMKDAMEGRRPSTTTSQDIEKMTAEAIGCTHPGQDQRGRLLQIIAALRKM